MNGHTDTPRETTKSERTVTIPDRGSIVDHVQITEITESIKNTLMVLLLNTGEVGNTEDVNSHHHQERRGADMNTDLYAHNEP